MTEEVVIGASGLVGSHLHRQAESQGIDVTGTFNSHPVDGLHHLDIEDQDRLRSFLVDENPDIVYLPAANPHVEGIEKSPEDYRGVNVEGPLNVASLCGEIDTKLVYFSSDYIFDGEGGPYEESDEPNPLNHYGEQKLEAERGIRQTITDHLILRTTVVFGWGPQGKNFVQRSLRRLSEGHAVKAPTDEVGTPTYVADLADAARRLARSDTVGTFNVAGSDRCSRYEFALQMAELFGYDVDQVKPISSDSLSREAERPLEAGLVTDKVEGELGRGMLSSKEGLRSMKEEGDRE